MRANLKPLSEQVVVVTGASSGIGLATARLAAGRGARVLMVARDGAALAAAALASGAARRPKRRRASEEDRFPDVGALADRGSGARWPVDDPRLHEPRGTGLRREAAEAARPALETHPRVPIG